MSPPSTTTLCNSREIDAFSDQWALDKIQGRKHSRLKGMSERSIDFLIRAIPPGLASITRLMCGLEIENNKLTFSFNNIASTFFSCLAFCFFVGLPCLVWSVATHNPFPWGVLSIGPLLCLSIIYWCTYSRRARSEEAQAFNDMISTHPAWTSDAARWISRRGGLRVSDARYLTHVWTRQSLLNEDLHLSLRLYGQATAIQEKSIWKRVGDTMLASYRKERAEQEAIDAALRKGVMGSHIEREELNDATAAPLNTPSNRARL